MRKKVIIGLKYLAMLACVVCAIFCIVQIILSITMNDSTDWKTYAARIGFGALMFVVLYALSVFISKVASGDVRRAFIKSVFKRINCLVVWLEWNSRTVSDIDLVEDLMLDTAKNLQMTCDKLNERRYRLEYRKQKRESGR